MELISIIVPIYNVESYLLRCVDSICRQNYRNLEIILVDDGSSDRCPQICDDLMRADPRIKVIHKENGGLGYARNSGLDIATGAYVTFVDSDDWIGDTHIENLYRVAKEEHADMVIGAHTSVSGSGQQSPRHLMLKKEIYEGQSIINEILMPMIAPSPDCAQDVVIESSVCTNLYRADIISKNKIRFISERITVAEDLYFNIDFLCHASRVSVVDEANYFYFENHCSHTRSFDYRRIERTMNFYRTIRAKTNQYGLEDVCSDRIDRCFLTKVRVAIRLIVISDLPKRKKMQTIEGILKDKVTREVLERYPIRSYIPAMRLLTKMMRDGNISGVYFLVKMREGIGRKGIIKAALKTIGIGK